MGVGVLASLIGLGSCGSGTEDPHSLEFKQKEADAYVAYLATKPDSAGLRLLTAQKLDSVGRYKEALLQIDTLIRQDSTKYGLWLTRANVLLDSADTLSAVKAFEQALTQYRGEEALLALGKIYAAQAKDTTLQLAAALSTNPSFENYLKGLYYIEINQDDSASSFLENSLAADPRYLPAYEAKARLLLKAGNIEEAQEVIRTGLRHGDNSYALLNLLAASFEKQSKPDSAGYYYRQSLQLKPYQPSIQQKISGT